jgi:PAS domain S-box-containing protein
MMNAPNDTPGVHDGGMEASPARLAVAPESVLRALSEAPSFLCWAMGPDGACTWFSAGWLAFTGRPLVLELGRGWTEGIHPGDLRRFLQKCSEGFAGRAAFHIEYLHRAVDGTFRDLISFFEPSLGPDASVAGFVGYAVDVTEEKQAQRALRRSEERFHAMADTVPDILFTARPDGVLDFVNRRFYEYTGLTEGWAIGPGWSRVLHPDDALDSEPVWLECCRQGEPYERRSRLRAQDGSYHWFVVRSTPVRDSRGDVVACFGCCTDVEALVTAEQALRESEHLFRTLCSHATVGIYLADPSGSIGFVNGKLIELTGRTPAELHGSGWLDCIHAADRERVLGSWRAALHEAHGWSSEHRLDKSGDHAEWVHWEAVPLRTTKGELSGYVGTVSDISKLKWVEEDLDKKARELFRSNADLEQFASTAAHDLRERIAIADLYLKVLGDRTAPSLDPDSRRYLHAAREQMRQLGELLMGLLAYSRVRPPEFEEAGICAGEDALENALSALSETIRASGAEITHDHLPVLHIDHTRLMQLFQNLVGNALKHHRDDPPRVHVSARREESAWVISVSDNGIGIKPEDAEQIFKIFWRGTDKRPGTGIGLAICKRIAEQVRGRIWVESTRGRGSTFFVSIPDRS